MPLFNGGGHRFSSMWSSPMMCCRCQSMITGSFHLFTIQARAMPFPLKASLHYDTLIFNTDVIQNPSQVSFLWIPSTRGARRYLICGLIWVWINLTKRKRKKAQNNKKKPQTIDQINPEQKKNPKNKSHNNPVHFSMNC